MGSNRGPWRGLLKRVDKPDRPQPWINRSAVGAASALVATKVSITVGAAANDASISAVGQALALAGLLLVPAAIFTAVVGAMFPTYWKATPQALIRFSPHSLLLTLLAVALGYGIAASVAGLIWPPTWIVAAPLLLLVGARAVSVIWLIGHSLAIIDPLRLSEMIREWGETEEHAAVAFTDLCRFARGMAERERRDVVKVTIRHMQTLWERRGGAVELDGQFAQRVLKEIDARWNRPDMRAETDACRQVMGLTESL